MNKHIEIDRYFLEKLNKGLNHMPFVKSEKQSHTSHEHDCTRRFQAKVFKDQSQQASPSYVKCCREVTN